MLEINGGANFVSDYVLSKVIDKTYGMWEKATRTPYEKTVTRGGKKYTVKYDGNRGW